MAGKNEGGESGVEAGDTDNNALNNDAKELAKFTGEVYQDGVKQAPAAKAPAAGAKAQTPAQKAAAAAAESAGTDADDDDDDGDDEATKRDRSRTTQARINKAIGKQRQAERDRDAANARYTAMEQRLAKLEGGKTQQQTKQVDPDAEPKAEDYDYGEADLKYIKDLAKYETRQELKNQKEKGVKDEQTAAQKAAAVAVDKAFKAFFDAGTEKFGENFHAQVSDESIKITQPLAALLLDSEHGIDIAFDISSDAALAKKVSAMSPERQAAWFGSYEEQHYSSDTADADDDDEGDEEPVTPAKPAKAATSKPISQAPKPPAHKNRGGGSSEQVSGSTSDFAAFERMALAKR